MKGVRKLRILPHAQNGRTLREYCKGTVSGWLGEEILRGQRFEAWLLGVLMCANSSEFGIFKRLHLLAEVHSHNWVRAPDSGGRMAMQPWSGSYRCV